VLSDTDAHKSSFYFMHAGHVLALCN